MTHEEIAALLERLTALKSPPYIDPMVRELRNPDGLEAAAAISQLMAENERYKVIIDEAEFGLKRIYAGDEGPVVLRGKGNQPARCARRHEAGALLRSIVLKARAALGEQS